MQHFESHIDPSRQFVRGGARLGTVLLLCWLAGCGKGMAPATQTAPTTPAPQTYFAPFVYLTSSLNRTPLTYTFDDVGKAFSQTEYDVSATPGPDVLNAGTLTIGSRGLESLDITITNGTPVAQNSSEPSSFAVELAGQAGGLVQLAGLAVQPLVAATQCPSFSSAQSYQFVTIPAQLTYQLNKGIGTQPALFQAPNVWNPKTDTAYGSVDIVTSGSTVKFQNIQQHILPSVGGTGRPAQSPSSSLVTGACGPTFFGSITNVPETLVITDPGGQDQSSSPQAHVGIGPTGLLVEDNGHIGLGSGLGFLAGTVPALEYDNVLGAGTGAVGLPKPTSALDTGTVVGKQYLGFIYAAGAAEVDDSAGKLISPSIPWSSNLASFGGSSQGACPSVQGNNSTSTIYGGDFPATDPTGSKNGGFGNCDFVIDLGQQTDNGLYPQAKVWLGTSYPGYSSSITYPFSAVAVAGQLGSQYGIFVIGFDSIQPWAIYLLSSN